MGWCPAAGHRARRLAPALLALTLAACGRGDGVTAPDVRYTAPPSGVPRDLAVLAVKGFGEIRIELFADKAPKTVGSFEKLAREGFYDGTTFHRVIPGFMIQGGDPNSKNRDPRDDGQGGPPFRLDDEINDVAHARGIVSMANTGRPDTAGSQFFIVVADSPYLNGSYTAFGRVLSGMDVVDRIVATPRDEYGRRGPPDRPMEDVVIESIRIEPAVGGPSTPPPPVGSGPPVLGIDLDSTLERAGQHAPLDRPAPHEAPERGDFAE